MVDIAASEESVENTELDDALAGAKTSADESTSESETESKTEDKEADDKDTADKDTEDSEEEESEYTLEDELRDLRQLTREQKKDLTIMGAKLDRLERRSANAPVARGDEDDLDSEEDIGDRQATPVKTETEELSTLEQLDNSLKEVATERANDFTQLVEVMKLNPAYKDVEQVCSEANFDHVFDVVAEKLAVEKNVPFEEARLNVQLAVWRLPNPYTYMYKVIKGDGKAEEKTAESSKKTTTKAADAPTSLQATKGGDDGKNTGWTAARIDALPEEDLHKVPRDIYAKYMRDELE